MDILVSVIIPVYNTAAYLDDCLKSVINQTLKNIEVICIDDASSDNSHLILEKYAVIDNRIRILTNHQNRGQSYSRNKGLDTAEGKYIYFLDADDMILPVALEELYCQAELYNLDVVYFDTVVYYEDKGESTQASQNLLKYRAEYSGLYSGPELFKLFVDNKEKWVSIWRQLWRSEFFRRVNLRFYEGIIYEDILFSFLAILQAERVTCLNKAYYIYRKREGSTTALNNWRQREVGLFTGYCEMLQFWNKSNFGNQIDEAIDQYLCQWYMKMINFDERSGNLLLPDCGLACKNHLFKVITRGQRLGHLSPSELEKIKQYRKIIVYGAGMVATEILNQLKYCSIPVYRVVVTDKKNNPDMLMGIKVKAVHELEQEDTDALMIISVTNKYKVAMRKNAEELGFKNFIVIDY